MFPQLQLAAPEGDRFSGMVAEREPSAIVAGTGPCGRPAIFTSAPVIVRLSTPARLFSAPVLSARTRMISSIRVRRESILIYVKDRNLRDSGNPAGGLSFFPALPYRITVMQHNSHAKRGEQFSPQENLREIPPRSTRAAKFRLIRAIKKTYEAWRFRTVAGPVFPSAGTETPRRPV
jgi:hypothetical protein